MSTKITFKGKYAAKFRAIQTMHELTTRMTELGLDVIHFTDDENIYIGKFIREQNGIMEIEF